MKLSELYDKIQSTATSNELLNQMLDAYTPIMGGAFYNRCQAVGVHPNNQEVNQYDRDKFHGYIENLWEQKTKDKANHWNKYESAGFSEYIDSGAINGGAHERDKTDQRLYINPDLKDIYALAALFVEKCERDNLKYHFKFTGFKQEAKHRTDRICIYSSTESLPQYLKILEEISKERPDIISRAKKPPVLTGRINDWLGYGDDPINKNTSYSETRANIIGNAIFKTADASIAKLKGNGNFDDLCAEAYVSAQLEYLSTQKKYYKLSDSELESAELRQKIKQTFLQAQKDETRGYVYLKIKDGSNKIDIDYKDARHTSVPLLKKLDPDFIKNLTDEIKAQCAARGIDPDKFCFDKGTKEKFAAIDSKQPQQKEPPPAAEKPTPKTQTEPIVQSTPRHEPKIAPQPEPKPFVQPTPKPQPSPQPAITKPTPERHTRPTTPRNIPLPQEEEELVLDDREEKTKAKPHKTKAHSELSIEYTHAEAYRNLQKQNGQPTADIEQYMERLAQLRDNIDKTDPNTLEDARIRLNGTIKNHPRLAKSSQDKYKDLLNANFVDKKTGQVKAKFLERLASDGVTDIHASAVQEYYQSTDENFRRHVEDYVRPDVENFCDQRNKTNVRQSRPAQKPNTRPQPDYSQSL